MDVSEIRCQLRQQALHISSLAIPENQTVYNAGVPLLGIIRGRLGFLTDVMPADLIACVDAALRGGCVRGSRRSGRSKLGGAHRLRIEVVAHLQAQLDHRPL